MSHRPGTKAHYRNARYYDQTYRLRRDDVRYYAALAAERGGPVLELGVGTGRVTLAIADEGVDVVGVDLMEPMLEQARARLAKKKSSVRERVELQRGDLLSLRLGRRFPLVIAPFNVFMHLYDRRDLERGLATVREHMTRRGRFVFDVLLPDPRALARSPDKIYRLGTVKDPSNGRRYRYRESFDYDAITQIMNIQMIFQAVDDPTDLRVTPLTHRQLFPAELEALLHHNGFIIEEHLGDFDGEPLDDYAESQLIVARLR